MLSKQLLKNANFAAGKRGRSALQASCAQTSFLVNSVPLRMLSNKINAGSEVE